MPNIPTEAIQEDFEVIMKNENICSHLTFYWNEWGSALVREEPKGVNKIVGGEIWSSF